MTKQEFTLRQLKRNKRIYTGCYYGYIVILAVALVFWVAAWAMKVDAVSALGPRGIVMLVLLALLLRPIKSMAGNQDGVMEELELYLSGGIHEEDLSERAKTRLSQTSFSVGKLSLLGVLCLVMIVTCGGGAGLFLWLLATDTEESIGFTLLAAGFAIFLIAVSLLFLAMMICYFIDAVDAARLNRKD